MSHRPALSLAIATAAGLSLSAMHRRGFNLNTPVAGEVGEPFNPGQFNAAPPPAPAAPTPAPPAALPPIAPAPAIVSAPSAFGGVTFAPFAGNPAPAAPAAPAPVEDVNAELARLFSEAEAVVATVRREARGYTPAEVEAQNRRFARIRQIRDLRDDAARFAALALDGATVGTPAAPAANPAAPAAPAPTIQTPTVPAGAAEFARVVVGNGPVPAWFHRGAAGLNADQERQRFAAHQAAINHYLRTGDHGQAAQFTLTTGTGSGVMVPTTIGTPLVIRRQVNAVRAILAFRGVPVLTTDSAEPIRLPIFDDTANTADVIAQATTGDNPKDPGTAGITLGAVLYDSGTVWSSNLLLRTTGFDLLGYIEPMLQQRLDLAQAAAWFTLLKTATVGKVTASQTGVTYAELVALKYSLPRLYRTSAAFVVSDGLMQALATMTDSQNRPLFLESMRDDTPDRLLGWPIFVDDNLATPAAGAISAMVVSADGLKVRDVSGRRIVRYQDNPQWPDQFGLRGFAYGDFAFQSQAARVLKHAP